jgi:hypothetical protein
MPLIDNFICICGLGMVESMLEPHLKNEAGSSQVDVGVFFFILGGFYMFGAIATGYVSLVMLPLYVYANVFRVMMFFRSKSSLRHPVSTFDPCGLHL